MGIGNSIIGALRVNLGLNSAAFTAGLKLAQGDISRFGRIARGSLLGLAGAAAGVAAALALGTKAAINHADALSKSAQKAGITTEALSRLAYAASFSDVSMEDLTGSLGKLSKTMVDATQNAKGPAASAFAALGISVTDASGKLRGADAVFTDIADRFSRIEDGATKTALAMAIFGKSGAELIPLLNSGRDGLKQMADESDRLGMTISTGAAKGAERFNDTMTKVGGILQGVVNKVMVAALPALQSLADTLASPQFAEAAAQLATWVVTAMDGIIQIATIAINKLNEFGGAIMKWGGFAANIAAGNFAGAINWLQLSDLQAAAANGSKPPPAEITVHGGNTDDAPSDPTDPLDVPTFTSNIQKAQAALDPFAARMEELSGVLTATVDPFSQMKLDLTDLQTMFDNGRISAEQFGDAVFKTAAGGVGALADLAGGLTSALSQMFKENKAIAAANAVVNGIGSVAKTFETYGATPWGFAAAAIAATTAAANVASILSTNENSKSITGGGGASSAAAAGPVQGSAINLTVRGSGSINVDDLADQLTKSIADGGNQNLVKVIRAA